MKSHFLVWNYSHGIPIYKHETYQSALDEAQRLAKKHPGAEFHVVKALSVSKVEAVTTIELED